MKRFFRNRRWAAFLLALVLVAATCIHSTDAYLWATDGQEVTTEQKGSETAPAEDAGGGHISAARSGK